MALKSREWITADRKGLREIHTRQVEVRGYGILAGELYQNVMDTSADRCEFWVKKLPGSRQIEVKVIDNGPGFAVLSDAWTLFAPSAKKANPTQAGRFNVGEKHVLSFAEEARIHTTSGTVEFNEQGRHEYPRRKRPGGTEFWAILRGTSEQYDQLIAYLDRIIVRPGLVLVVNGNALPHRTPIHVFREKLPTEVGETLARKSLVTDVSIYEPSGDETPMLYELGIPVVETGDRWHYSIGQKVPLNVERDNVEPRYLRTVRVAVFNQMHSRIADEDTETAWVNEATSDERCTDDAAETFRAKKYGEDSVAFDPSNPEANAEAVAHGRPVIPPRGLTPGQRSNLYRAGTLITSSKAFPTAGKGAYSNDPNAEPVKVVPEAKWSEGMRRIKQYTEALAFRLMGITISVRFVHCNHFGGGKQWAACYGRGHLLGSSWFDYNIFKLGRKWFDAGVTEDVDQLILHEFGHQFESNHLSEKYYDALTMLGARLKREALKDPQWFRTYAKP